MDAGNRSTVKLRDRGGSPPGWRAEEPLRMRLQGGAAVGGVGLCSGCPTVYGGDFRGITPTPTWARLDLVGGGQAAKPGFADLQSAGLLWWQPGPLDRAEESRTFGAQSGPRWAASEAVPGCAFTAHQELAVLCRIREADRSLGVGGGAVWGCRHHGAMLWSCRQDRRCVWRLWHSWPGFFGSVCAQERAPLVFLR